MWLTSTVMQCVMPTSSVDSSVSAIRYTRIYLPPSCPIAGHHPDDDQVATDTDDERDDVRDDN